MISLFTPADQTSDSSVPALSPSADAPAAPSRRDVLTAAAGLATVGFLSCGLVKPALAAPRSGAHRLAFRNTRTGESFNGVYRVGDKYLPEAFEQISHILRDNRNGEVFPIDPRVMDILYVVHRELSTDEPFQILSGYRSPRTNAMLARASARVARHSLHMTGQAIDVRLETRSPHAVRKCATTLAAGGVGSYPRANFVHLDSGSFRTW
jgi:uncharacterized protein YcbK (DUF882 family)